MPEPVWASSAARDLAAELGVDGLAIAGSGRGGRITAADVRAQAEVSDIAQAPDHLSARAQGLWRSIVAEFLLAPHQIELLRRACESSDRADQARELLLDEGLTTTDRYGQIKPHPAANIERDSRIAEARLIRELALTPEEPEEPHSRPPRAGTAATAGRAER